MDKCVICGKNAAERFCYFHEKAYENVKKKYKLWNKAVTISQEEYLNKVVDNPNTGLWVKEVAKYLLKCGEIEKNY